MFSYFPLYVLDFCYGLFLLPMRSFIRMCVLLTPLEVYIHYFSIWKFYPFFSSQIFILKVILGMFKMYHRNTIRNLSSTRIIKLFPVDCDRNLRLSDHQISIRGYVEIWGSRANVHYECSLEIFSSFKSLFLLHITFCYFPWNS